MSCPFDQKATSSRDAVHELIKVVLGNCGIVGSANDEGGNSNFPEPSAAIERHHVADGPTHGRCAVGCHERS